MIRRAGFSVWMVTAMLEIAEYACHAGNYSMTNMIRGEQRAFERQNQQAKDGAAK